MYNTEQPSGFFQDDFTSPADAVSAPEPFYISKSGYSILYRYNKDGKFRILKGLLPQYSGNPFYEELLRKEYEIGYEMEHPNICRVYSYSRWEGLGNCIEMEWVDGNNLRETSIPKSLHKKVLCEICDALSYIHHKQTVHRDLKPENILITHNGSNVKIVDFGLSDTDWHSVHKGAAGTKAYAAPELLAAENTDNRCDIWSLGKIMLEIAPEYGKIAKKCTHSCKNKRYADAQLVKDALMHKRNYWHIVAAALLAAALVLLAILASGTRQKGADIRQAIDAIFEEVTEKILETGGGYATPPQLK